MTTQLSETWADLRQASRKTVGGYRLALVHSGADVRTFAAVEAASGLPGILVELPTGTPGLDACTQYCKAFTVTTAAFPGMAPYRVGVLTMLGNVEYEDLFSLLTQDLLDAVGSVNDPCHAVVVIKGILERWRYFTDKRRAPMTEARVRGLIGELLILARLLQSEGPLAMLRAWTGPSDALHDFEMPSWSGEVKTFLAEEGPTVRISDPRQLEIVQQRPVYLIPVKLARTDVSGKVLSSIIENVKQRLLATPGASELFELKLAEYGYLPAHAHLYTEPYACEQVQLFVVRDAFPRIAFDDVPSAVTNVQYSLSLGALSAFAAMPESILGAPTAGLETSAQ